VAEHRGDAAGAAEMLGAAARLRGADDPTNQEIAALVARVRAGIGDAPFEAAYARGREAAPETPPATPPSLGCIRRRGR
jgi:hypothetical protein